jgi:D-psicose/D-tagatose/L-ribulose 3-epimerase
MKFGTYFAYWNQDWEADYIEYCQKVADLGFDVLEVSGAGIAAMDNAQLDALKKAAEDAGILLSGCFGLAKEYDVASEDEKTRQNGLAFMKMLIEKLDRANIRSLAGIIYSYWPYDYNMPVHKEKAREISIKSMRELGDFAKEHNVVLSMEAVNRFEHFLINDAAEAIQFAKDIGKENVKVLLDTFHMNIEEDNMADAIRAAGPYLGHFHIGECNRKVPGKGHMPWDEISKALRDVDYQGYVVMEPFVRTGGTVGQDIKVWRDLSGNADEAKLDEDIRQALQFVKSKFLK